MSSKANKERVIRTDGKPIFVLPKRGHLLVCARGCCCGHTERNIPAVPIDFYKEEYKRRKIRDRVQLTMAGCLGPCPLANVILLFFDGQPMWFQGIDRPAQIVALYDYIDRMLAAAAGTCRPSVQLLLLGAMRRHGIADDECSRQRHDIGLRPAYARGYRCSHGAAQHHGIGPGVPAGAGLQPQ
jgi:hypothetical protein